MSANDLGYYRKRAAEERELAAKTLREDIAQIHLELAEKYESLAEAYGETKWHSDWSGSRSPHLA